MSKYSAMTQSAIVNTIKLWCSTATGSCIHLYEIYRKSLQDVNSTERENMYKAKGKLYFCNKKKNNAIQNSLKQIILL